MLDIGWTEVATIVILAVLVIGPKDLPKAMRGLAKMIGKARAMMREFQSNIDDMIKETELDEVKKQIQSARNFDMKSQISNTIDPKGEIDNAMDFSKEASDFNKSIKEDTTKSEPAVKAVESSADSAQKTDKS